MVEDSETSTQGYSENLKSILDDSKKMKTEYPKNTKKNHTYLSTDENIIKLDDENFLIVLPNVLTDVERTKYIDGASNVARKQGPGFMGHNTPRAEVCYTKNGDSYKYSGKKRYSTTYPKHVEWLSKKIIEKVGDIIQKNGKSENPYTCHDTSVDIIYNKQFKFGGSIGKHSDDEYDKTNPDKVWGLVAIYSLGQSRYLRVADKGPNRSYKNIELKDNSVIAMYGPSFQEKYTHQVDCLKENEKVGTRLSLNIRYHK